MDFTPATPPPISPRTREQQLISMAMDVAEQQMREGKASSQVITHYLKLGTEKERLELDKLRSENQLLKTKVKALETEMKAQEDFREVIKAIKKYGNFVDEYEIVQ